MALLAGEWSASLQAPQPPPLSHPLNMGGPTPYAHERVALGERPGPARVLYRAAGAHGLGRPVRLSLPREEDDARVAAAAGAVTVPGRPAEELVEGQGA